MHRRFVLPFLMVIAVLLVNGQARAAGYALYEFSARGDALGGAMVGRADDPSAIAYNPAGITQLPGAQVMAGMTVIAPSAEVKTPFGTESAKDNVWFPPHAYYTQQLNDKWWFGMGLFSRFGLATEFSDDWAGRYNNYYAHIKSASLNPVLAYKVTDELSLAAGVEAMWFQFTQKKNIDPTGTNNPLNDPANDIRSKLDGTAYAPGLTAAVHYKPLSWLAMGATYRSQMELDVQGWADFTKPGSVPLPPSYFDSTHASGRIILPDMVFAGVTVYPVEDVSVEVGAVWTHWSTYDQLSIDFDNDLAPGVDSSTSVKDWHDTWRYCLGVEWAALPWLDVRGSYVYDQSPIDDNHADYLVPANDRMIFSGGLGFNFEPWVVDLSYSYLHIQGRAVSARPEDGVVSSYFQNGQAHMIGASVSYAF
jgi:long-chain fatty acid transport protein